MVFSHKFLIFFVAKNHLPSPTNSHFYNNLPSCVRYFYDLPKHYTINECLLSTGLKKLIMEKRQYAIKNLTSFCQKSEF